MLRLTSAIFRSMVNLQIYPPVTCIDTHFYLACTRPAGSQTYSWGLLVASRYDRCAPRGHEQALTNMGASQLLTGCTSPFYGQPYLFCLGDVAAPHSLFLDRPLFDTLFAATNTEFPLVTCDTMSRPLPEHSTNTNFMQPHRLAKL